MRGFGLQVKRTSTHSATFQPQRNTTRHRSCNHRPIASSSQAVEVVSLVAFSALPFVGVQALADSQLGKQLLENLENQKPSLRRRALETETERAYIRSTLRQYYGPDRPLWLPRFLLQPNESTSWLDGSLPGDYGFDPFGFGKEKEDLDRYVELELLHARWAMLGLLGALVPEILQRFGGLQFLEAVWWKVGAAKLNSGEDLNYLGINGLRAAGSQGIAIIALCQFLLMFGPEYARACGITALEPLGIFLPGSKNYPGGLFDPLNLSKDAKTYELMRVREIKNGRLAMVAWLGFFAAAAVTKLGPIEALLKFFE